MADRCTRLLIELMREDRRGGAREHRSIEGALDGSGTSRLLHDKEGTVWPMLRYALGRGYDARIGFEDTLAMPDGTHPLRRCAANRRGGAGGVTARISPSVAWPVGVIEMAGPHRTGQLLGPLVRRLELGSPVSSTRRRRLLPHIFGSPLTALRRRGFDPRAARRRKDATRHGLRLVPKEIQPAGDRADAFPAGYGYAIRCRPSLSRFW
jgi:hypothetical protein